MKNKKIRIISAFLAVIFVLEALPLKAIAFNKSLFSADITANEGNEVLDDESVEEEPISVEGELESERDADSKQFKLSDGTVAAVQYDTDVHYQDDSGQWMPIDNSLSYEVNQEAQGISLFSTDEETDDVQDTDGYETKEGKVNFKFAKNANQKNLVRIQQDDYKISFALKDHNENKKVEIINSEQNADDGSLESQMTADNVYSTVQYSNIQDDIDLQYTASGSNLKENIIINKEKDSYQFAFDLKTHKLNVVQEDDGTISLYDYKSNKLVYSMPAMYMTDTTGAQSDAITYSLEQVRERRYILTITADKEWINAEDRQFPVTIDPTLSSQHTSTGNEKTQIFNYYVTSGHPTETYQGNGATFLGYDSSSDKIYRHFVQFKQLPSIPRGSVIASAKMYYAQTLYDDCEMSSIYIAAKEVTSTQEWKKATSWNTQPKYSGTVLDYQKLSKDTTGKYVGWDITPLIKSHYESANQANEFKSFVLTTYNESQLKDENCAKVQLVQDNSAGYFTGAQPILQIIYRDTRGIEDYYTYTNQSVGQAGTAYIGDYNDQLTLVKNDLTNTGSVMNFVLSHVYNTATCYANFTADRSMHTKKYMGMYIGRGWRLSVQETIVEQTISNTKYYVYSDGDGTEHYFYYDSDKKQYVDEDGLNLTLSIATKNNNQQWTIADTKGNQKIFINGYLSTIQDCHKNQIVVCYNGNDYSTSATTWMPKTEPSGSTVQNRVTSIVQINNGKSVSTIATLSYGSDGYLTQVKDKSGRATSFTYAADSGDPNGAKNLVCITHPDSTTAGYGYRSGGYLTDVYDGESRNGVQYSYYSTPKLGVLYVTEYSKDDAGNTITGAKMSIGSGEINQTAFRDYGADAASSTADDIKTYTTFDNAGRTINTISVDVTEKKIYGVDSTAYTTNSKSTNSSNNRVKADVATGLHAINLLSNASGEAGSDGIATGWTYEGVGTGIAGAVRTDSLTRTGNRGFKIWMGDTATPDGNGELRGSYKQTLSLEAGKTYTFSGYVNTSTTTMSASSRASLRITDAQGNLLGKSKEIDYQTPTSIEDGWERLNVTVTPATTATYQLYADVLDIRGIAYWDDFQMEEGDAASSYNMINDGSFEQGTGKNQTCEWVFNAGMGTTASYENNATNAQNGNRSLKMTGIPTGTVQCYQTFPVNQSSNNTYVLSGWAKANSVSDVKSTTNMERFFGFYVNVNYSDGNRDVFCYSFCADLTGWQYLSAIIVPKDANKDKTISSMTVFCLYNKNANTAQFDNISLKKEPAQTYKYDTKGNLVAVNQSGTTPLTSVYTGSDLTSETDGTGTYKYEHNSAHDVTSVTNDNIKLSLAYDTLGNTTGTELVSTTNATAEKLTSTATYSSDGNYLTGQTDTSGITTTYKTNTYGLVGASTNAAGTTTTYHYDANTDRQTLMYITGKVSAGYTYAKGNLTNIQRGGYLPDGSRVAQTYSFTYDTFGNKTGTKVGGRTLATYEYAPHNGNLVKTTYANGNTVEIEYDIFDRVVAEKHNGVVKYKYTYNGEGDLAKKIEVDASGNTVNVTGYEYDSLDRLIHSWEERDEGSGLTEVQRTEHIYDTEDRISSQSWSVGGGAERAEKYTYSTTDGTLSSMQTANGETISFGYDGLKRLSSITGTVTGQKYTYRSQGNNLATTQIAQIDYTGVQSALNLSYEYDAVGNVKTAKQNGSIVAQYEYDEQNQLVSEVLPQQNLKYEYVYDTCFNLRQVKTYQNGSETPTITEYGYADADWADLMTRYNGQAITYDAIGNPLTYNNGTAWTFTWQGTHDLATATANGKSISYHYDMDGVRDSKTVNGVKHEYITQSGNVTLERWNDGEAKSLEFIYDNGSAPYSVIYKHGSTTETYYYILNQQGDVIRIVDADGTTKAQYTYNAWGEILGTKQADNTIIGELNPIRYRGYYYDSELNMYYLQSRYYDPVVKRMLSADDENITDDATLEDNNLFAYCDNEPIGRSDDEGDFWQLALAGGGIASGSGAVLASVTPVGLVVVGVAVVATVGYHAYRTRTQNHISYSKAKSRYNQKEKQKKQAKKDKKSKEKSEKKAKRVRAPIARRVRCNTRKKAFEKAKRAGKNKKPISHYTSKGRKSTSHFHPNVSNKFRITPHGFSSHDHFFYPR